MSTHPQHDRNTHISIQKTSQYKKQPTVHKQEKLNWQILFLQYYFLRSAISEEWKRKLQTRLTRCTTGPSTLYFTLMRY